MYGSITITPGSSRVEASFIIALRLFFFMLILGMLLKFVFQWSPYVYGNVVIGTMIVFMLIVLVLQWKKDELDRWFYRGQEEPVKDPRAHFRLTGPDGSLYAGPADVALDPDGKMVVSVDLRPLLPRAAN